MRGSSSAELQVTRSFADKIRHGRVDLDEDPYAGRSDVRRKLLEDLIFSGGALCSCHYEDHWTHILSDSPLQSLCCSDSIDPQI